jgi:hypothetical protein
MAWLQRSDRTDQPAAVDATAAGGRQQPPRPNRRIGASALATLDAAAPQDPGPERQRQGRGPVRHAGGPLPGPGSSLEGELGTSLRPATVPPHHRPGPASARDAHGAGPGQQHVDPAAVPRAAGLCELPGRA